MIRTIVKYFAALLGVLLLLLISMPWWFNWNWLRGPIASAVEQATGRTLEMDSLAVDPGRITEIRLEGLRFSNAEWADSAQMLELQHFKASIELLSLLKLDIVLPEVRVENLRVDLARDAEGRSNWAFGGEDESSGSGSDPLIPTLQKLRLQNVTLSYQDAVSGFSYAANMEELTASAGGGQPIQVDGRGRAQGAAFELSTSAGTISALQDNEAGFPLTLALKAGRSALWLNGSIDQPRDLAGLNLDMRIKGPNLDEWYRLSSIPLPETPPYELAGRLQRAGTMWRFDDFDGRMGDSDLGGDFAVDLGGERMAITADLRSRKLDLDDLGPLIGRPPDETETASAEQEREAEQADNDGRLIPDKRIPLGKLRIADAQVKLLADEVLSPALPVSDLELDADLDNGVLRVSPFSLGFAGGRLNAYATIDATVDPVIWNLDFRAREIELVSLLGSVDLKDAGGGRLSADLKLKGRGKDLRQAAADSSGRISMIVNGGRFSGLLMELIGLDVAESLGMLVGGSNKVDIRCLVVDLDVNTGQVESRSLVLDTSDTRVNGKFEADLESERFDLKLEPEPKDPSLFTVRTPFKIDGRFADINIAPDYGVLGLRLGAAAALGALATPAALLAFIEPGPASDAQCEGLLGEARREE